MSDTGTTTTTDAGTTTDNGQKPTTFSQAEVDRIVQERLGREKQRFADYDDLKAKASKFDDLDAASKSELQKATERAEAAEKRATEAADRAKASDIRSAVTAAATTAGAIDIDAVLALIPSNAVTVGDDGRVTGADTAVKALLESKPYLVGRFTGRNGSAEGGARGEEASGSDMNALIRRAAGRG